MRAKSILLPNVKDLFPLGGLSISILLILAGCAGPGGEREGARQESDQKNFGSALFPVPPEIKDNVDFWRHVYGVWGRGEVAIHDDAYLNVIYEVAHIPGPAEGGYTGSQQHWLDARVAEYASRLRRIEQQVHSGQKLAPSDQAIMAKFAAVGGNNALSGAAERVRAQRGLRERFRRGLEISGRYDRAFREVMNRRGVPEDLAYLPHVESSFQTNAKSGVGAGGVWQFMPATGRLYMDINDRVDERYDPILAADGAARYLAQAYQRLKSWPLAITSYNHGQGGMEKARSLYGNNIGRIVKNYKGPAFGFASRNFYSEFVAARDVAQHATRYFPEGVRYELPWSYDRLVLRHSMPADHLARYYGTSKADLADLNLHWREAVRSGRVNLPVGSTVWLPQGSLRRVANEPPPPKLLATSQANSKLDSTHLLSIPGSKSNNLTSNAVKPIALAEMQKIPQGRYHIVKSQETLSQVAADNGISVAELKRLNQMSPSENQIQPGQRLKVGF